MEVKELGHLVLVRPQPQALGRLLPRRPGMATAGARRRAGFPGRGLLGTVEPDPPRAPPHRGGRRRPVVAHRTDTSGSTTSASRSATPTTSSATRCGPSEEAGATVVGTSDHTVTHSLYILDPDGNEIELYVDVAGVDWKSDPSLVFSPIRSLAL